MHYYSLVILASSSDGSRAVVSTAARWAINTELVPCHLGKDMVVDQEVEDLDRAAGTHSSSSREVLAGADSSSSSILRGSHMLHSFSSVSSRLHSSRGYRHQCQYHV